MRLEQNVQDNSYIALNRILSEYKDLARSKTSFSLLTLLSHGEFQLDKYCKEFIAHPYGPTLKKNAKEFCDRFGIWLPGGEYYITCAMYLFPTAPLFRIIPVIKNNAIDFYLNDVMGREVFNQLPLDKQMIFNKIKENMSGLVEHMEISSDAHPIEFANWEMLQEISNNSPTKWFMDFLKLYCYHIELAHKDCNSSGMGYILSPDEYIHLRSHISGMPHTVMFVEFCTGNFLSIKDLDQAGLTKKIERINWVVSLIGCLMNDLFSFEKEVIDNYSDSNLVMIIVLNNPGLKLEDAILQASEIVRDLLIEFVSSLEIIRKESVNISSVNRAFNEMLDSYLSGLERCVQACWVWQVYTKRYKRPQSIWNETRTDLAIS